MISFLPESWFPKKQNFDFHTPDRWWISPRIIHLCIITNILFSKIMLNVLHTMFLFVFLLFLYIIKNLYC